MAAEPVSVLRLVNYKGNPHLEHICNMVNIIMLYCACINFHFPWRFPVLTNMAATLCSFRRGADGSVARTQHQKPLVYGVEYSFYLCLL